MTDYTASVAGPGSRALARGHLRVVCLSLLLFTSACGTDRASHVAPIATPGSPTIEARAFPLPESADARVFRVSLATARLRIVDVADVGMDAMREREGATLVFNGGFFDPEFQPEGLAVSGGVVLSEHVESLSGGVVWIREGRASLAATEGFVLTPGTDFAIQCRPRLVVDGAVNISSETGRRAARTAICIRDGGATLDVVVAPATSGPGPTLLELAEALLRDGCRDALNLDGGPSTAAAWQSETGAHLVEPAGPVRHAIVIEPAR